MTTGNGWGKGLWGVGRMWHRTGTGRSMGNAAQDRDRDRNTDKSLLLY